MSVSKDPSALPSSAATPVASSPPPSESYLSDLDGTASVLDTSFGEITWDPPTQTSSLNLVSWKLDVNAHIDDGIEKRGFNAISTVLAHPTKKANPLRGSRKPLPPLNQAPPILPKAVPASHFDSYLNSITPAYEAFVAAQAASSSSAADSATEFDARRDETPKVDLPPLDSVPELYFDTKFDIANPSTWSDVVGSFSGEVDPSIQDKLSNHLDTLERHLVHEITLRSTSFFSALSNLQDLHSESASCLTRIGNLRSSLKDVGSKQAKRGLEVVDAQARLRVLRATETGVRGVADLEELLRVAKSLVDGGDWEGALGCLEDVVRWWERHEVRPPPPAANATGAEPSTSLHLPLSTLPALSDLPSAIRELTKTIATQLESVLASLFTSLLARADSPTAVNLHELQGSVRPMLAGLVRCGRGDAVEDIWKEVVAASIREASKGPSTATGDDDGEADGKPEVRNQTLVQILQAMDNSQFLLTLSQMYTALLARIKLCGTIGTELQSIMSSLHTLPVLAVTPMVSDTSRPSTPKPYEPARLDSADVVSSACELANTRAAKILVVRSEQLAALELAEFVEIFGESWQFVLETEALAQRMIVSLRGVTASQARAFLVSYHAQRLTKSAKLVEEETWVQVDVSKSTQHIVDLVVEAAVKDPNEVFIPPREEPHAAPNGNGNGTEHDEVTPAAGPSKQLMVEDKPFFIVKATGESLVLLGDYLKIVINLELVVTDVMSRIIEFFKSFNSRTCQVVLGAGAMRSAGLKNITAKHLALASQSLSAVVSLIPYIREFIRRHLNPKQAVMLIEFDKLRRDYQEHQNEIHAKLVAIMADRLAVHCASLREIDWEAEPERPGTRPYAEMLVKETATLHKVLSKYLATPTVEGVMSQVLAAIVHRLSEEYGRVEFKSEDAKKRMTADVQLIVQRLTPLSESSATITSLETVVRDKPTPRRAMSQTVRGLLRRTGSATESASATAVAGEAGEGGEERTSGDGEDGGEDDDMVLATEPVEMDPVEEVGERVGEGVTEEGGEAKEDLAGEKKAEEAVEGYDLAAEEVKEEEATKEEVERPKPEVTKTEPPVIAESEKPEPVETPQKPPPPAPVVETAKAVESAPSPTSRSPDPTKTEHRSLAERLAAAAARGSPVKKGTVDVVSPALSVPSAPTVPSAPSVSSVPNGSSGSNGVESQDKANPEGKEEKEGQGKENGGVQSADKVKEAEEEDSQPPPVPVKDA